MFRKYMHIERLGSSETEGLLDGTVYVFYKIDGTNGSVWWDTEKGLQAGSRNRVLSLESDNAGFCQWVYNHLGFIPFKDEYKNLVFYGEWLVPHSLKTYREDSWRRFYVFDVYDTEKKTFLHYEAYKGICEDLQLDYIPPIAIINRASPETILPLLEKSGQYLVKDGEGKGEGIVIKNYSFVNKYKRTCWAKMITNEFKEKHHKEMGAPEINGTLLVEQKIIDEFLTEAFILKEKAKIELEENGWSSKMIPKLFGVVFYEFIREETWNWIKKHKNPQVSFSLLNRLCIQKVKETIGI